MASSLARSKKSFKRVESKKSHSWWWDSHVTPKNNKWLAENLEEMDQSVKRMLKLIEEDGDSFAKKAEMYYQKRPELISHVEEFYRMYRSLAERYNILSGELKKSASSDIQSQGSGVSDVGSEPPSSLPSPDQRLDRRRSGGPRPAGFDVFLGKGNSADLASKETDETSSVDSESDSDDDSSVNDYSNTSGNSDDQGLQGKIVELEAELCAVKEKLKEQQEGKLNGSSKGTENGSCGCFHSEIGEYKEELRLAKEKIQISEEEITKLKIELQNSLVTQESVDGTEAEVSVFEQKNRVLEEELEMTKARLTDSEKEVANLRSELENNRKLTRNLEEELDLVQKDVSTWKAKVEKYKTEVLKLEERTVRYKDNLADREHEIRDLRETLSNANKALAEENLKLQAEIAKLVKERGFLEDNLKVWELKCQCLEDDLRRVNAGKAEMESIFRAQIGEKDELVKELELQKDVLNGKLSLLRTEIGSKDVQIDHMGRHLHQLHIEHVDLISRMEKASKTVEELRLKCKELEIEVEKQKEVILEGGEEKREAIRQLCFSLEHYRNGYHMLRQAFAGHKKDHPVMAGAA